MIRVCTIICSHNPRPEYLQRVLEALRAQTLPRDQWELLLIDNASDRVLANEWDLSWHSHAQHVREDELGLTPARLRGIAEARGDLLVFVDDDNVLDPDYLQTAIDIDRDYSILGAWGGTIKGEFEAEPEPWMRPLLGFLAIREYASPVWGNNPEDWAPQPCGAGLCVRRSVAAEYARQLNARPARRRLDRVGSKLSSCGDSDLVQTSCSEGKGFGNFPGLRLTHLIPENRVQPEYIVKLMQGIITSQIVLRYFRTGYLPREPSVVTGWLRYAFIRAMQGRHRAWVNRAHREAIWEGIRLARETRQTET